MDETWNNALLHEHKSTNINFHYVVNINNHCTITFSFNQLNRKIKDFEGQESVNQQKKNTSKNQQWFVAE